MPISRAMWIHGHAIRIENSEALASIWRAGFYVQLVGKPSQSVWVHYAIPTPVIVNDNRLRAGSVMIRCRTIPEQDAWLAAVHVYDGERSIAAHNGLRQYVPDWTYLRYDIPGDPEVRWGIGISIKIGFNFAGGVDVWLPSGGLNPRPVLPVVPQPRFDTTLESEEVRSSGAPAEASADASRLRYAIEISAVGCDFLV